MLLLGDVNAHIKMTEVCWTVRAPGHMETLIKMVESIRHPVLYDLFAAEVLMQHLAFDTQVASQN